MTFLSIIGAIVVIFWIVGLIFSFGGWLIHILLVIGLLLIIIDWITGRRK